MFYRKLQRMTVRSCAIFCMNIRIFSPFQNTRRLFVLVLNSGPGSLDYAKRFETIQGMGLNKDFSVTLCNKTLANLLSVSSVYPKEFFLVFQLL